jgi:hypothetical protein
MQEKGKVTHYKNRKFGKLFAEYVEKFEDNKEVVEKLYNNLPKDSLGKTSLTGIIQGYQAGNLSGAINYITENSVPAEFHADRLFHILNFLDVPSDSEMIELARETLGVKDFEYPPTSKFGTFSNLRKVKNPGRP